MRRRYLAAAALAAITLAIAPAVLAQRARTPGVSVSPAGPPIGDPDAIEKIGKLDIEITTLAMQLAQIRTQLGDNHPRVVALQKRLEQAQNKRQSLVDSLGPVGAMKPIAHLSTLVRPIDLVLKEAQVEQAAQAISQAVGIQISVDKSVGKDTRVTMSAMAVPLVTVLDTIASQAGLRIQPTPQGVLLTTWPAIRVGNDTKVFTGPYFPWSDEWGRRPTEVIAAAEAQKAGPSGGNQRIPGVGSTGTPKRPEPTSLNPPAGPNIPATGGFSGIGTMSGFGGITTPLQLGQPSITSLGNNTLVIAEPETGPDGKKVVHLTVYRYENSQLKRISQTTHKSEASGTAPQGMGSLPGMSGSTMSSGMAPAKATPPARKPSKRK